MIYPIFLYIFTIDKHGLSQIIFCGQSGGFSKIKGMKPQAWAQASLHVATEALAQASKSALGRDGGLK